jgi:flagellin
MRVNTNVASLQAQEAAKNTSAQINKSLEKLGTGHRINTAADDAAGLAIADKLRTQATSLSQAVKNGNAAISLTRIADKAMDEISNIINTIKQKALQAQTATTSTAGKKELQQDVDKLLDQINNIKDQTNYNGTKLLDAGKSLTFQLGEDASNGDIVVSFSDLSTNGLDIDALQVTESASLSKLDDALECLNLSRGRVGAGQNQLESAVRNIQTAVTNLKAAESVIRDVDYAEESANFNKLNIISQAGTYAISQANAAQQNVMKLLQ